MRFLRNSFLISALVVILAASVLPVSAVDFSKPSAVISFGGYDKLVADLNSLGEATGQPGMGSGIDMMAKMMLQGTVPFDQDKPWGVAYASGGADPSACLIFGPVPRVSKLNTLLATFHLQGEKIAENYYKLPLPPGPDGESSILYVKQQKGWAFGAFQEALLEDLPADPETLLEDVDKDYLFAIEVYAQNGGIQWIQGVLGETMQGFAAGQQAGPLLAAGKTPQEVEAILKNAPAPSLELNKLGPVGVYLDESGDQVDTLTLGVCFAKSGSKMKSLQFDAKLKALPGTDLAKEIGSVAEMTSDFAGFYDTKAAVSLNMSSQATPEMIPELKKKVASFQKHATEGLTQRDLNEDELATAKAWVDRLARTIETTVEKGRLDVGFQFKYVPNASTVLLGIKVADSRECGEVVEQLGELFGSTENSSVSVTLDEKSIEGVTLHKIRPVSVSNPEIFGENPEMVMGVLEKTVYVGLGKDPTKGLKSVVGKSKSMSAQTIPIVRMSLDLSQLTQMTRASLPEESTEVPGLLAEVFQAGVDSSISVQVAPKQDTLVYRLELPASVVGALFKSGMGQMMPGGGGMPGGGMPMMMSIPSH